MGYPISDSILQLFLQSSRQLVKITVNGVNNTFNLDNSDIIQGSMSINRYVVSGSNAEIGTAVASEITLSLNNSDGRFNDISFEGAELYVQIGIEDADNDVVHYIPMGYFNIDNSPRMLSTISLVGLDRMVLFDKPCNRGDISFPTTVGELLTAACIACNAALETSVTSLINYNYVIPNFPETSGDLTYRQILQWIAEITGTCAYMDWSGKLRLEWYSDTDSATLTTSNRYSSDLQENPLTVSGVRVKISNDVSYELGSDSYMLNIESNSLIQDSPMTIVDNIYSKVNGMTYTPFNADTKPFVNLFPLDRISFKDKDGNYISTVITNMTYKLNGRMSLSAKGETNTKNGYGKLNPLTKQESVILSTIKNVVNEQLNERTQSVIALNETIAGALGLYYTEVTHENGSVSRYFHNAPVLSDSQPGDVIYTMRAGGFACCTSGWNNGNPVWTSGITKDGNAVFRYISAEGIEVSDNNVDYFAKVTPEAFEIWYRAVKIISANADESQFTKLKIKNYLECGNIRIMPYDVDGNTVATIIAYIS